MKFPPHTAPLPLQIASPVIWLALAATLFSVMAVRRALQRGAGLLRRADAPVGHGFYDPVARTGGDGDCRWRAGAQNMKDGKMRAWTCSKCAAVAYTEFGAAPTGCRRSPQARAARTSA